MKVLLMLISVIAVSAGTNAVAESYFGTDGFFGYEEQAASNKNVSWQNVRTTVASDRGEISYDGVVALSHHGTVNNDDDASIQYEKAEFSAFEDFTVHYE